MREIGFQLILTVFAIATGFFGTISTSAPNPAVRELQLISASDALPPDAISATGVAEVSDMPPDAPDENSKLIALTFDDGPGKYTEELLDKLTDSGVTATFFLLGNCAGRYPDTVRRMAEQGFEIGVHTYTHPNLTRMSAGGIRSEISRTITVIRDAVPEYEPAVFRPPGGAYNKTVRDVCAEFGMSLILWSVDPKDWKTRNADKTYEAIFSGGMYSACDGAIILMHDIHKETVVGIDRIIERLKSEGYTFVTVSELLELRRGGAAPGTVYSSGIKTS